MKVYEFIWSLLQRCHGSAAAKYEKMRELKLRLELEAKTCVQLPLTLEVAVEVLSNICIQMCILLKS